MRYRLVFGIFAFFLILDSVLAIVELGNLSHNIQDNYGRAEPLKGWVNFSLSNENENSLIKGFNNNITIKKFLEKNGIDCTSGKCSCFPNDCKTRYSTIGSEKNSDSFSLNMLKTKLIGVKLKGNISQITNFGFNVSTNAGSSCLFPLIIDLLDDNEIEFKADKLSNDTCYIEKAFGCFKAQDVIGEVKIVNQNFCQRILIPPYKGYKVGAKINGTGSASFSMTFDGQESCTINVNSIGEKSCNIILDEPLNDYKEVEVCISANEGSENKYGINYEDNETCGFTDSQGTKFPHDFEIFAKPLMYDALSNINFAQNNFPDTNLSSNIMDYISEKYRDKCEPECIIPIRIYSGINQNLNIFNLNLGYQSNGLAKDQITGFYEINKTPVLLSSEFLKLELEKADILTPSTIGNKELILKISDKEIKKNISVLEAPRIKDIIPKAPVLLVPTKFTAILEDVKNKTYIYNWDFGDGNSQTTFENTVEHTYTEKKEYKIKLNVSNELGETTKTVIINVVLPYNAINNTLNKYKKNLRNVDNSISFLPSWIIQKKIKKLDEIENLKSSVERLETRYKQTLQSEEEELIKIMNDLVKLKVPEEFNSSLVIKPSKFIQNKDRLDVNILEEFGAGNADNEKNNEEYNTAINQWLSENMDITFESKTYLLYYENTNEILFSHVKLILTPKKDVEIYIVTEGSEIKFKEDYNERELSSGYGIKFSGETAKTIEFLYPETIDVLNLPVYVSPEFKNLEFGIEPGICNYNKKCEKELGEDYKNCRNDCKPWPLTFLFLAILVFITFIIYLILQEWYKRYYENYLFKDKNQLFNLITFMSNSANRNMSKKAVFEQLKPYKWSLEQLDYAWNKLHGKRTGMFEIPIFMQFEKMKIKKEIEKRMR